MSLPRESDPCGEVDDALKAEPEGLHTRLAIALARREADEHGHQAHHFVEPGRGLRHLLAVQDVSRLFGSGSSGLGLFQLKQKTPQQRGIRGIFKMT